MGFYGTFIMLVAHMCLASALSPCTCPRNYRYVCGSDGKTYDNECILNCESARGIPVTLAKQGPCEDEKALNDEPVCACGREFRFVCGSDGVTYTNVCLFNCVKAVRPELTVLREGPCDEVVTIVTPKQ